MRFDGDIPEELARAAHGGTSFDPEQRGKQEVAGYVATLEADYAMLLKHAPTPEKVAELDVEFARYRDGYRKRTLAHLVSRSRCMSTMIAGPSNFPARRMERRYRVTDRRLAELIEYRKRALAAITKTLHPEWRPIMSGDADAIERMEAKISAMRKIQDQMKAANAAIRKHQKAGPEAQVFALVALGFSEKLARTVLEPDCCGRIGFADFETKNNGAQIRAAEKRLAHLKQAHATPNAVQANEATGIRLEVSASENRVRIYFPGKPDEATRSRLKASGFRWAPTQGAWSGYHNHRTLSLGKELASAV